MFTRNILNNSTLVSNQLIWILCNYPIEMTEPSTRSNSIEASIPDDSSTGNDPTISDGWEDITGSKKKK